MITDEKRIQEKCNYEANPDPTKPKFFCTFPYQYQNGISHLGHAYTILKGDFNAKFMSLNDYNVLFPIGFHGTGTPIVSCATKLKESLAKYGDLSCLDINSIPKNDQIRILYNMNIKKEDIPKFTNPYYWLEYFPIKGVEDMTRFGISADFRRCFITTDINPHYDSFIKWQFDVLNNGNNLKFGKKPIIFSPKDNQPCADHDRTEQGEGVEVKEFHVFYSNMEELIIPLTFESDKINIASIKSIIVSPNDEFVIFRINHETFVTRKEYVRNFKHQIDSEIIILSEIKGTDIIGKNIKLGSTQFTIQKSNVDGIIGCGFKILFNNKNNDNEESMIVSNCKYYEPERPVTSRSGDQCVVALVDQWFIDYSSPELKKRVNDYIMSNQFNTFDNNVRKALIDVSNWITFWPCS
ncbi:MAG: class I tRNA ligase family protein, partial [Nitrososphaeraceae archaeon]|nr:class I tRNA ligase family protein [Nitrososphaeraceae archaeon]